MIIRARNRRNLRPSDWAQICDTLNSIIERGAFLCGYISRRFGTDGTGEHPPADAVKQGAKEQAAALRAMGFTMVHPFAVPTDKEKH